MNELLQEIQAANKCDKCGGSGKRRKHFFKKADYWPDAELDKVEQIACPSCTGGFIVPELEKTAGIYVVSPQGENDVGILHGRIDRHHNNRYDYVNPAYVLPDPTLPEVLDMLPEDIGDNGDGFPLSLMEAKVAGEYLRGYSDFLSSKPEQGWNPVFSDPNPLIAALKLLLWYIKQRKEGKA